ncbi:hypothetical protein BJ165DRAFT_1498777 [Panaeolus papilionaceus]|nr:hypothetical protein BJ165DRAFT_1498777 [Panaeolus papilionaceus]
MSPDTVPFISRPHPRQTNDRTTALITATVKMSLSLPRSYNTSANNIASLTEFAWRPEIPRRETAAGPS